MIFLHSVTKLRGRGDEKINVIDEVDWTIEPRTSYVILGHRAAGKSTLLHLISGTLLPTEGWVERRGTVSYMSSLSRLAGQFDTPQHLTEHLAVLYGADAEQLCHFVSWLANIRDQMTVPIRRLPPLVQQKLSVALFYALPCDLYLFDARFETRLPGMREKCRQLLAQRKKQASMILATSSARAARSFGGTAGILFRGKLRLFESLDSAVEIFQQLPVDAPAGTSYSSDPMSAVADLDDGYAG